VTIRGLSFTGAGTAITNNRAARGGVFVLSHDLTIEKNFLGIAPDGSPAGKTQAFQLQPTNRGLSENGLRILDNVIGANANMAIDLAARGFSAPQPLRGLRIAGNLIGVDPTGTQPRPNGGDGIVVAWSAGAQIVGNMVANSPGVGIRHRGRTQAVPGSDPALDPGLLLQGNVVEGNAGGGIVLDPNPAFPVASQGDPNTGPAQLLGNTVTGNGAAGISVLQATGTRRPNIQIGGTSAGQPNTITANNGPGIAVGASTSDTSVAVTARGNSIYANTGRAIDLATDGPTANGPAGTARTGPNALVNFPVITSIAHASVIVAGTYAGAANATYTLDFYKSQSAADPQTWIGSAQVTTDAGGNATFRAEFVPDVPAGWVIAATATDADGSTSELGDVVVVPAAAPPAIAQPSSPGGSDQPARSPEAKRAKPRLALRQTASRATLPAGQTATYTIRVTNPSDRALHEVRTCEELPSGLVYVRSTPGAKLSKGRYCWTAKSLGPGRTATYRLTVRALARRGRARSRAVASAPDARARRVTTTVRVLGPALREGGVTG
jgi:uncharacterized repeat protein (TIGR01451 family)